MSDSLDHIAGDLDNTIREQFELLRELGIVPHIEEHNGVLDTEEFKTEREEAMYLAGRISGLSEAQKMIDN